MDIRFVVSLAGYGGFSADDEWCLCQDVPVPDEDIVRLLDERVRRYIRFLSLAS